MALVITATRSASSGDRPGGGSRGSGDSSGAFMTVIAMNAMTIAPSRPRMTPPQSNPIRSSIAGRVNTKKEKSAWKTGSVAPKGTECIQTRMSCRLPRTGSSLRPHRQARRSLRHSRARCCDPGDPGLPPTSTSRLRSLRRAPRRSRTRSGTGRCARRQGSPEDVRVADALVIEIVGAQPEQPSRDHPAG